MTDTFIVSATTAVIVLGIKRGLERTVRFMFPTLIILMLILVAYGMTTDYFYRALIFII
ncbi:hypothetical protein [Coxiella endosymbiont of Ornithodoros maritimus]|uniref:hypothetical protein n=1 Tax=Coxiella endosymbiont of Ornithodoros maritimus TaxID=1656172 RepID=UPI002263E110|nr:hypothetical protein [Coxiella endosymbiont of Ornithodoros maritimus]